MEVRQDNFLEVHDVIEAALKRCDYFSVDLEFTGIDKAGDDETNDNSAAVEDTAGFTAHRKAAAICETLVETAAGNYAHKKAAVDQFAVMQIGISTFELVPVSKTAADDAALAKEDARVQEVQRALSLVEHYMLETSKTIVLLFHNPASDDDTSAIAGTAACTAKSLVHERLADDQCFVLELKDEDHTDVSAVRDKLIAQLSSTVSFFHSTLNAAAGAVERGDPEDSVTNLDALQTMECALQLIQLYTQWMREIPPLMETAVEQFRQDRTRRVQAHQQQHVGNNVKTVHPPSDRAPVYLVRSFYAFLFPSPASNTFRQISLDSETVGVFLLKNNLDCGKWVKDGLRYTTLPEYTADRAKALAKSAAQLASSSFPHENLPGYTDTFADRLDDLFPLKPEEIAYVEFAINLPPDNSRFDIIRRTAALFRYARACAAGTAFGIPPPDSSFIGDRAAHMTEERLLKALGIRKTGKRFESNPLPGGTAGALSDVVGLSGTASTPSACVPSDYYGSKLLATILTACQTWRKPLVVHNGYSDLAFLLRTLYGALPATYADFKALCRRTFPIVYDTRTLTTSPALQHLGNMHGRLEKTAQEVEAKAGRTTAVGGNGIGGREFGWALGHSTRPVFRFDASLIASTDPSAVGRASGLNAHNAGFDACITGKMFAYAKEELYRVALTKATANENPGQPDHIATGLTPISVLAPYEGKLPLYGSVFYVNLGDIVSDSIFVPPNAPIAFAYGKNFFHFMEDIREAGQAAAGVKLAAMCHDMGYIVYLFSANKSIASEADGEALLEKTFDYMKRNRKQFSYAESLAFQWVRYAPLLKSGSNGLVDDSKDTEQATPPVAKRIQVI